MKPAQRYFLSIVIGIATLGLLVWISLGVQPNPKNLLPNIFFGALVVFTSALGAPMSGGLVTLMPMTLVAAFLVAGLIPATWMAFIGAVLHIAIKEFLSWREAGGGKQNWYRGTALASANAALHALGILAGGLVYLAVGGETPLETINWTTALALVLLGLVFLAVNYTLASLLTALRGWRALEAFWRSLPQVVLYEGFPLVFAPFMALVYSRAGLSASIILALAVMAAAMIMRNLSLARNRLERRVKELDTLQAVGRVLSASLDLKTILSTIYTQVSQLMPAEYFYVALYDRDADEVSFPLVVEQGEQSRWTNHKAGQGLTEYILQTGQPLLSRHSTDLTRRQIGLPPAEQPAASWLGVPMKAGGNTLGVIAVQSYTTAGVYDTEHQELLMTIAAQAGIAIENARLYARTDEALARRVQELDSIIRATREGILLMDLEYRVLAANPTLGEFLDILPREVIGQAVTAPAGGSRVAFQELIGYPGDALANACRELLAGNQPFSKDVAVLRNMEERHVERSLIPVRSQGGGVSGWLLVFRDLTEEIELARLQEEMLSLLVHDMRSPLAILQGGLGFLKLSLDEGNLDEADELLKMALRGSNRVLQLVNELLDISKLESGVLTLNRSAVPIQALLSDIAALFAPVIVEAQIRLSVDVSDGLPDLYADPEHITRVLINLVDNAVKFTPDGGQVRLAAQLGEKEDGKATVVLEVSDTGAGIPPEVQARLFEKYQQAIRSRSRRRGTGLGLYYCRLAVEAHNGQIWLESQEGQGSRFFVRLPVAESVSRAQVE